MDSHWYSIVHLPQLVAHRKEFGYAVTLAMEANPATYQSSNRTEIASPWAGRFSASARVTTVEATSRSASLS